MLAIEIAAGWDCNVNGMWETFGLGHATCIALIGAGGKTTLMLALAAEARRQGFTVAVTTTTKIWPPPRIPLLLEADADRVIAGVRRALRRDSWVALGRHCNEDGKVVGLEPAVVCALVERAVVDVVLCEADGAAGRPLKVHGAREPVIPACATGVAMVCGLDAVGLTPGPDVIHRFEAYLEKIDSSPRGPIGPEVVAETLIRAAHSLDRNVPVVFVLNKADDESRLRAAHEVSRSLHARLTHPNVMARSHLGFIQRIEAESDVSSGFEQPHASA